MLGDQKAGGSILDSSAPPAKVFLGKMYLLECKCVNARLWEEKFPLTGKARLTEGQLSAMTGWAEGRKTAQKTCSGREINN